MRVIIVNSFFNERMEVLSLIHISEPTRRS